MNREDDDRNHVETGGERWGDHLWRVQNIIEWRWDGDEFNSPRMAEQFQALYPVVLNEARVCLSRPRLRVYRVDPREAAQEWFMHMMRRGIDDYHRQVPLIAFVRWVTNKCCNDLVRALCRVPALPGCLDVVDDGWNPMQEARRRDMHRKVNEEIERLNQRDRQAIRRQYWDEIPADEIADFEGISRGAVDSQRFRARGVLRGRLREFADLDC